jgi:hypothetical protein
VSLNCQALLMGFEYFRWRTLKSIGGGAIARCSSVDVTKKLVCSHLC